MNCAIYMCWLLKESGIPSRIQHTINTIKEKFTGHTITEFYDTEVGAWIPADLSAFIQSNAPVSRCLGQDLNLEKPCYRIGEDMDYWLSQFAGTTGNGIILPFGGVPYYADEKRYARAAGVTPKAEYIIRHGIV